MSGDSNSRTRDSTWRSLPPVLRGVTVALILAGILLAGVGAVLLLNDNDVGVEMVKTGLTVGAVTVAGLLVQWGMKAAEERRELRRERLELIEAVVDVYHRVKSERRRLRTLGMRREAGGNAASEPISADIAARLRESFDRLNDAQLILELHYRMQPHIGLVSKVDAAMAHLKAAADYLHDKVLQPWETFGVDIREGNTLLSPTAELEGFFAKEPFKQGFRDPLKIVIGLAAIDLRDDPQAEEARQHAEKILGEDTDLVADPP